MHELLGAAEIGSEKLPAFQTGGVFDPARCGFGGVQRMFAEYRLVSDTEAFDQIPSADIYDKPYVHAAPPMSYILQL